MTARTRTVIEYVAAVLGAGVFAAGATWGATRGEIEGKLDTTRFTLDSAYRAGQQGAITDALRRLEGAQQETNNRLREIACPPGARGCR